MNRSYWSGLAWDWGTAAAVVVALYFLYTLLFAPSAPRGPAPDFTLADLTGTPVQLSQIEGPVILNFWFTNCPPCRHEIPELVAYHQKHPDVPLYGVSIDQMPTKRLSVLSRKLGITYPVLHDKLQQVAGTYGVNVYPTTLIIKDGQIVNARVGEVTRQSLEYMVASSPD